MPNGQKEKGRAGEVEQAARRGSRAPLRKSLGQVVTGEVHPEDPRQRTVTAKAPPDSVAAPKGLRGFPRGVTPDTVLVSEIQSEYTALCSCNVPAEPYLRVPRHKRSQGLAVRFAVGG